jgi:hypothetical protein
MLLCGSAIFWLDARMRQWFGLDEASRIRSLRTEVLQVAMQGTDTARLTAEFESLLAVRYEAPAAVILARSGEAYTGGGHTIRRDRVAITALREEGWITPESLQRRRPNPALEDLDALLRELGAGALVAVPRESPVPNLLVAIGVRRSEWPFTYPDVTRLLHTAELIDNILTRSRLTDQLALRARMEYLAMMSRGLAHDLKNLITPVSSYLVHTEGREPGDRGNHDLPAGGPLFLGPPDAALRPDRAGGGARGRPMLGGGAGGPPRRHPRRAEHVHGDPAGRYRAVAAAAGEPAEQRDRRVRAGRRGPADGGGAGGGDDHAAGH